MTIVIVIVSPAMIVFHSRHPRFARGLVSIFHIAQVDTLAWRERFCVLEGSHVKTLSGPGVFTPRHAHGVKRAADMRRQGPPIRDLSWRVKQRGEIR